MWIEKRKTKSGKTRYAYYERYECPVTGKTKRVSVTLCSNSRTAVKQATAELQMKIEAAGVATKKISFADAMDEMIEFKKYSVKPATYSGYIAYSNRIKKEFPTDILLERLTLPLILEKLQTLHYEKNLSRSYISSIINVIKNTFRYAKRMRWINDITFLPEIKIKYKPKTVKEVEKKRNRFLEKEEVSEILSQLKEIDKRTALLVEFLVLSGLRIGEAGALRKQDFDGKGIDVNGNIAWELNINDPNRRSTPKTASSHRYVLLNDRARSILRWFIADNSRLSAWDMRYKDKGYIFTNSRGNPQRPEKTRHYLKMVDIGKDVTPHMLRHTHISMLAELGVPIRSIMERVGHSNPRMTLEIYSHVTRKMQEDVVIKLDDVSL